MSIIGLSGKKQSGKDTVGKIIKILMNSPQLNNEGVMTFLRKEVNSDNSYYPGNWQIKKFADKLKDIVCLLIGCTREQLEDEDFKSKELGEEWWCYKIPNPAYPKLLDYLNNDLNEEDKDICNKRYLIKMTPRLMLQLLGTECGRQIIHPQIWVNSLMTDYKPTYVPNEKYWRHGDGYALVNTNIPVRLIPAGDTIPIYPNWIITDTRFPNEQEAVIKREGINIRVNRIRKFDINDFKPGMKYWIKERFSDGTVKTQEDFDNAEWLERFYHESEKPYIERMINGRNSQNGLLGLKIEEHESETALDDAEFDYVIDNDGTMDELIDKVRRILQAEFVEMKFYNN